MSKLKYKSIEEFIDYGIPCLRCRFTKAKYQGQEDFGTYISLRFVCPKCGKVNLQFFPQSKWKEYLKNAKR